MHADELSIALRDGRSLDVHVSGESGAPTVVFHHGTPGARTPIGVIERAVVGRGLRLVTFSRPGYGASTRREGRNVADAAADTQAVLDAVGAARCWVAGWSGGGPHALACAARLAGVEGVLVIAGVAPYDAAGLEWMEGMGEGNVVEFGAALEGSARLRPLLVAEREQLKEVEVDQLVASMASILPAADRSALSGEVAQDVAASFREALRHGVDGWLDDDLALTAAWGFDLAEITVPTFVWQGSSDLMVPASHGSWLAEHVPGSVLHLQAGHGHISLVTDAVDRMFDELMSRRH